jgi:hypothetical protein
MIVSRGVMLVDSRMPVCRVSHLSEWNEQC